MKTPMKSIQTIINENIKELHSGNVVVVKDIDGHHALLFSDSNGRVAIQYEDGIAPYVDFMETGYVVEFILPSQEGVRFLNSKKEVGPLTKLVNELIEKKQPAAKFGSDEYHFVMVGYKSPGDDSISGPYLVTRYKDMVIEVDRNGKFVNILSGNNDNYVSWIDKEEV